MCGTTFFLVCTCPQNTYRNSQTYTTRYFLSKCLSYQMRAVIFSLISLISMIRQEYSEELKYSAYHIRMVLFRCHLTGSEIVRGSAEFRVFSRIFGHLWDHCKSGEKFERLYGGGLTRQVLGLQKWFTYQNLQNFTRTCMKVFSTSCFHLKLLKFREDVGILGGSFKSKLHVSDPRKHAPQFFSLNCNFAFHSLHHSGAYYNAP